MQREAVRVVCWVRAREVHAEELLLGRAVREDVRERRRLDERVEEGCGVGGGGEVVDYLVGPRACGGGVGGRRVYPGAELGVVGAAFDRRGDEGAFEPVWRGRELGILYSLEDMEFMTARAFSDEGKAKTGV